MKRLLCVTALLCVVATVGVADAKAPTARHRGVYLYLRRHVEAQFGHIDGRNIVVDGRSDGRAVTDAMVVRSSRVMERWLAPPPLAPVLAVAPSYTSAPAPASYGGSYAIPSGIVRCESGGNWRAVNPSSGAGGAYQILPSTWAAYGGQGLPENASPAEQSSIAARIYAAQGPAAWSCKA